MNTDQLASVVRTVMKVAGTFLATKGLAIGATDWETITGAVVVIAGVVWSHYTHKEEPPIGQPPTK